MNDARSRGGGRVGVVERRGRFMVVEPFFERGRRITVDVGAAATSTSGDSCSCTFRRQRPAPRWSAARAAATSPRDVIEALMLDRGLRAGLPARRRARGGRGGTIARTARAPRPARPADVHDRPRERAVTSTTRSRRRRDGEAVRALGAHRRRHRVRAGRLGDRPRGRPRGATACTSPAPWSRCCRRRCPAMPARSSRGVPGGTVTVEIRSARRAGREGVLLPQPDPLRRALRPTSDVDRMFAGEEPRA